MIQIQRYQIKKKQSNNVMSVCSGGERQDSGCSFIGDCIACQRAVIKAKRFCNPKNGKPVGEWIMLRGKIPVAEYKEFAKEFNPVDYNPESWVLLAKEAGMKYIVITTKHHDGFAMFDTKASNWNIMDATPYGKDVLKPLAEACKKHGIKLGFYYSQAQDWCNPGGSASGGHWDEAQNGDMTEYLKNIAVPQVKEILSNYGKISVLWWDTPIGMTKERQSCFSRCSNFSPALLPITV